MVKEDEPAGGRPRDPAIDRAVLAAALELLEEVGYAGFSIQEVARRAATTKPAVYRRWAGRAELALAALGAQLEAVEAPDTGCTLCDLDECLRIYVELLERTPPDVLASLLADCAEDPHRYRRFMEIFFEPPRRAVGETLDRAIARGDLRPDVDRDLLIDLLGSLVHYRTLFGHARLDATEIERAVESLLRGVAVDYEALWAHAQSMGGEPDTHHLHSGAAR